MSSNRFIKSILTVLVVKLNPLVQHYTSVQHDDPKTKHRLVDLHRLASEFNVKLAPQHSCAKFADSKNGEFVHYEITDKFQFLGGLTSKLMVYRACFRPLYDESASSANQDSIGLETISDPGSGVALLGKWVVSEDEERPGFLTLTETVKVHCNVFLGWYVRSQLESAHASLHKEFGLAFCEKMMADDPAKDMGKAGKTWKERAHQELQRTGSDISPISRTGTFEAKRYE